MEQRTPQEEEEIKRRLLDTLGDRAWRMDNLYKIVDKYGRLIKFKMRGAQRHFIEHLHNFSMILKARQLGFSTLIAMFMTDYAVFNPNRSCGIIDWSEEDAVKKLDKCRIAYNNLPDEVKNEVKIIKDNEKEIRFSNGSSIIADTSFRGGTLQMLHVSEYAKICKRDPIKAREIKEGAINAVAPGFWIFIESTAEGSDGDFHDMYKRAEAINVSNANLTELDYKSFFYPWWGQPEYRLGSDEGIIDEELEKYFIKLEDLNIRLDKRQKLWYAKKKEDLGEGMFKEFPSYADEAFMASDSDKYYHEEMRFLNANNRICEFDVEPHIPVDVDWDIGHGGDDYTAMIFSQQVGKELRIIDYVELEVNETDLFKQILWDKTRDKGYTYGTLYFPHDGKQRQSTSGKSTYDVMAQNFSCDVGEKLDVQYGINWARKIMKKCWFKKSTTKVLLDHLANYSKKWSEGLGRFVGPSHDKHSHASDAYRGLALRFREIEVAVSPWMKKKKDVQKKKIMDFGSAGWI